ncbi:MAG TPA: Flp family type IVb pilin [Xanthobacteraceae bacterium]|jgi:Flp pilus assembly pilin Flp
MRTLVSFVRDESGTTSVKYGLIAVCISAAIATVLQGVGDKLKETLFAAPTEFN